MRATPPVSHIAGHALFFSKPLRSARVEFVSDLFCFYMMFFFCLFGAAWKQWGGSILEKKRPTAAKVLATFCPRATKDILLNIAKHSTWLIIGAS